MSSNAIFVLIPSLSGHSAVVNYGFYYNAHFVQVEQFVRFALSLDSVSITALHVITSLPSYEKNEFSGLTARRNENKSFM
jgi:hypothetical protein